MPPQAMVATSGMSELKSGLPLPSTSRQRPLVVASPGQTLQFPGSSDQSGPPAHLEVSNAGLPCASKLMPRQAQAKCSSVAPSRRSPTTTRNEVPNGSAWRAVGGALVAGSTQWPAKVPVVEQLVVMSSLTVGQTHFSDGSTQSGDAKSDIDASKR